ncbi:MULTISPECIES: tyrosine-type recombinase/integrase [Mumia]|nr:MULTISPECIES: site-specific integrase [Mumia]
MLTGSYVDPRAGKVTFEAYARTWQDLQMHRTNTALAVDSALRVHAIPAFGKRPIASIRRSDIQSWVQAMSAELAPATVRVTFQHARSVFRAAVDDRLIARTPCERITLPRIDKPVIEPLPTETVLALEEAMPPRWRAIVRLMAGTGVRPGEAAGVTLDRIDFLRRSLRVDRQLLLTRPHTFGPPKTDSGIRTIPLPQVVVEALSVHVAEHGTGVDQMLFANPGGGILNRDLVTRAFRDAVREVGAPDGTRLHDLRHYYASLLIRHGESVKVVQARLGHASAKETLDTYSHLWPDSEDMTRAAIDSVLGATRITGASNG